MIFLIFRIYFYFFKKNTELDDVRAALVFKHGCVVAFKRQVEWIAFIMLAISETGMDED
jgi:hypothetical protein